MEREEEIKRSKDRAMETVTEKLSEIGRKEG